MTTDEYKMVRQTNDKVEVKVEVNYVATSDDSTITNEQYLPPSPPTQVFRLKKAKVKKLKAFLMSKLNPTRRKKDALLENAK